MTSFCTRLVFQPVATGGRQTAVIPPQHDVRTSTRVAKPPTPDSVSTFYPAHAAVSESLQPPQEMEEIDPALTGVAPQHIRSYRSNVLFVGNLTWWVTDAELRTTFDQFGTVHDVSVS